MPDLTEFRQGLHLLRSSKTSEVSASIGFLLALIASLKTKGVFVWVFHDFLAGEAGSLYGPGLWETSSTAGQIVLVAARSQLEMFWAVEEAISSPVVTGVSGIFHCAAPVDLKFTRRISLRSEKSGVPVYLVTVGGQQFSTSAATHWNVSHAPSQGKTHAKLWVRGGNPCWNIGQTKNKKGSFRNLTLRYDPITSSLHEIHPKVDGRHIYSMGTAGGKAGCAIRNVQERSAQDAVVVPFAKPVRRGAQSGSGL